MTENDNESVAVPLLPRQQHANSSDGAVASLQPLRTKRPRPDKAPQPGLRHMVASYVDALWPKTTSMIDPKCAHLAGVACKATPWLLPHSAPQRLASMCCSAPLLWNQFPLAVLQVSSIVCRNSLKLRVQRVGWKTDIWLYLKSPFHTLLHVRTVSAPPKPVLSKLCLEALQFPRQPAQ